MAIAGFVVFVTIGEAIGDTQVKQRRLRTLIANAWFNATQVERGARI